MTGNVIPYEHTDRLRAILTTYFPFLHQAGFEVAESTYDVQPLVGRVLLRRPDVVIEANLRNDDLDLSVAPATPNAVFVKVNLVVLYLKRARVDYAEFMRRQALHPTETDQEEIWRATAARRRPSRKDRGVRPGRRL